MLQGYNPCVMLRVLVYCFLLPAHLSVAGLGALAGLRVSLQICCRSARVVTLFWFMPLSAAGQGARALNLKVRQSLGRMFSVRLNNSPV
jgi:hypothetical protein